jgi:short-subunit dehydrogenase
MPAALITGASRGIGRELADLAARDGYDVILVARSGSILDRVAADLRQKWNCTVFVIAKDLTRTESAAELFEAVQQQPVELEVLVNNAGFGLLGKFWELDLNEQLGMVQLNVAALTALTRLFLPKLIERRRGMIMNIASTAAFQPGPLMSVYYATKSYVLSLSEAIHNEAKNFGVTVTCICPGPTSTDFDARAGMASSKLFKKGNVMSARTVAEIGWNGMKKGKPLVITGRLNALMAFLTRFAPIQFTAKMARRMQET